LREKAIETNNPRTTNALPELRERERERKRDLLNEEEKRNAIHYSIVEKKKSDTSSFPILLLKLLCRRRYPHQRGVSLRKTKINRSNHISSPEKKKKKKKKEGKRTRKNERGDDKDPPYHIDVCVCVCVACCFYYFARA
jgi:hypothetical protein